MKKLLFCLIPLLCIVLMFTTCSKKTAGVQSDKGETAAQPSKTPTKTPAEVTSPDTKTEPSKALPAQPVQTDKTDHEQSISVTTSLGNEILQLDMVHFDYDSYELRPDAIAALEKAAKILKKYPDAIITIEGHCDERGTVEYNLALGERRAHAVKTYFINYGINPNNLITISYGKEKPIDPGHNEDAWSKNRRAVLVPSDTK
ncbi:MAG TPA: peptidoglycan-associated lipoprotein Pal [Candidatus Marinimicrobia bacterium]|nr:peptidoglycan-associated lipoprotein Pal [Candidatus Neomarinimicrobiota bacterium]HRS50817.1 peptidoglycan-associated lipoprotein Pal [Candidatus Neomarinimicrobiota bacterium]HRU91842.1 peptidoglycan-associated lipoprotein Pal [Candidatus Neomarinimicrobiota bacterium]